MPDILQLVVFIFSFSKKNIHVGYMVALLFLKSLFILCVLLACMYVHYMHHRDPQSSEEGIKSSGMELQMVVSHHVHVRNQTLSSASTIIALNY